MSSLESTMSGDRARLVTSALHDIAAGDDRGSVEAAGALIRWSMRLLDISGAGVMMADERGVLRSVMVSSEAVRVLEADELEHGRGPCVESHRTARAVIHADVDVVDDRWPQFGLSARAGGMRAAHAIPVLDGGAAIGVLNLFRTTPGGLTSADAHLAHDLAGAVRVGVDSVSVRADQVVTAFADAAVIERAKGILAVRLRVDIRTAAAVLRHVARERHRTDSDLAADVGAGPPTITLPLSVTQPSPDATETD